MSSELVYQVALTQIPQIGPVQARILVNHFGNAEQIFKARTSTLEKIEGIGSFRARNIISFKDFQKAEKEIRFNSKYGIRQLFILDDAFPKRLLNCYDPPTVIFYRGDADLNLSRFISVIGTRNYTDYGKQQTEKFLKELVGKDITVVSGLAYGIDAIAHKYCLRNEIPTIGVVAHGLDQIYPSEHATLAKDMIRAGGGILTEYLSGTKPDKHNFPVRNRIVAGMCDATIVIETGIKGGSMITAELANGYNRDVFALPGRVNDHKSEGCNELISSNKAVLLRNAQHFLETMSWADDKPANRRKQREIFIDLSQEEKKIVDLLIPGQMHIDELNFQSGLSYSKLAAAILSLEIKNIVESVPGKMVKLV